MVGLLSHRGPDAHGVWTGDGIALGHTRLSILDLSEAGAQPMTSPDGRWTVSYNGEIYNHLQLRDELPAHTYRGHSDTETVTWGLSHWGFAETLLRLKGMFAIAAWDSSERKLYLARDRAGQKPLFYGVSDGTFVFGSELKVLRALPSRPEYDLDSFAMMLRYNNIPAPRTVYRGFHKLPAAHYLVYQADSRTLTAPTPYWSLPPAPVAMEAADARSLTLELLRNAVRSRMLSDVPLGAFLSGGIDSSLVVALMQEASPRPVQTFTIDFDSEQYSEAAQAKAVAHHLGTEHTEHQLTVEQAQQIVTTLGSVCDEPFGDSSLLPTLLLSQMTRRYVTVALTGDGGDELFGGYHRQLLLPALLARLKLVPLPLRKAAAGLLSRPAWRQALLSFVSNLSLRTPEEKLDKLVRLLVTPARIESLYRTTLSQIDSPADLLIGVERDHVEEMPPESETLDLFDRLCRADFGFYMPNDVLVKVDRASMACGLEARSPFMDHALIEHAFRLEKSHKVQGRQGKQILRSLLGEFLPALLIDQPKMGFAVPLAEWLRGGLKPWASDLLNSSPARKHFRTGPLQTLWADHQAGRNRHHELWNILMLISWLSDERQAV